MNMLKTLLLPVLFMASAAQAQPLLCSDLFQNSAATFAKAYPSGVDPVRTPGGYMQIGYESEYCVFGIRGFASRLRSGA